ncbi:VanW family protein [Streptomyces sp. APSN-46.1]|uniref:VanW family protein n=1 Tax=Streptomyces sp. APSN-46.1 TaxID=2929049 RepID=UPI001FB43B6F|nr:VanW family protein [Streptomyces sp. APSN-46.1]MCJ1676954.1 VanW family protein [Streptomyces sp. APSN-46.1]
MRRAHGRTINLRIALPLAAGAAVLGFGGLYVTGLVVTGDAVADGTTVRGVDIGGMSRTQAKAALDRELGPAAAAPIELKIGDRTEKAAPASFGLSVDTAATAESATNTGSDPFTVIGRLFAPERERDIEPVIRVDGPAGTAAVGRLADAAGRAARSGAITFDRGTARVTAPVTGVTVRADRAADTVRAAYLHPQAGPVALPVEQTPPAVGPRETARALKEFAEPAMSGPVTLTVAGKPLTLSPALLGKHLALEDDGHGRLVPRLDSQGLLDEPVVARLLAAAAPRDATFRVDAANRAVVDDGGRDGVRVTAKALGDAVLPLLTRTGAARTAEIAVPVVQPRLTAEEAQRLGIKEKVSSFTVAFPAAPYRSTNIGRAVELINGSVVLPGETWSFNKTVGERTKENGFVDGIMIADGQYKKSSGGGVSAVATTMFNAMFFAGVKPVEYGAHSFYIERYPEGREATVAWGTLDLRWRNDSGHALYVRAESTDTSVTITLLGTKKYEEIRATQGPRTHVTPPGKRTGVAPVCEAQTPLEGFDVSVDRVFVQGGQEVKRETFRTHYTPRDEVTCEPAAPEGPGAPAAPPTRTPAAASGAPRA